MGLRLRIRHMSRATPAPAMAPTKKKHAILIVDDEVEVARGLRGMFRRDYDVHIAHRAVDALEILRQHDIHVLVSDQRMPDMSGTDFLAQVATEFPEVVRLMITGYADLESVIDAINRGQVYRYLSKPWDPAELACAVRQAAEQYDLVAEKTRLLRELEEANQLKSAFIAVASHELNTPLTIVSGMVQLALSKSSEAPTKGYLERAMRATRRLQALLSNTFKLLQQDDFHRSLERQEVSCSDLFAEIREDLEPYLSERRHVLAVSVDPPDLSLRASRIHLRDVLENLLTNAIKFSPDDSEIALKAAPDERGVRIEVIDHGVGIPWEDQPHVFEPLFSTWDTLHHSSGDFGYCKRGMGLGLAIVKKFVEMHGGEIGFDSVPGKGATFHIQLPRG